MIKEDEESINKSCLKICPINHICSFNKLVLNSLVYGADKNFEFAKPYADRIIDLPKSPVIHKFTSFQDFLDFLAEATPYCLLISDCLLKTPRNLTEGDVPKYSLLMEYISNLKSGNFEKLPTLTEQIRKYLPKACDERICQAVLQWFLIKEKISCIDDKSLFAEFLFCNSKKSWFRVRALYEKILSSAGSFDPTNPYTNKIIWEYASTVSSQVSFEPVLPDLFNLCINENNTDKFFIEFFNILWKSKVTTEAGTCVIPRMKNRRTWKRFLLLFGKELNIKANLLASYLAASEAQNKTKGYEIKDCPLICEAPNGKLCTNPVIYFRASCINVLRCVKNNYELNEFESALLVEFFVVHSPFFNALFYWEKNKVSKTIPTAKITPDGILLIHCDPTNFCKFLIRVQKARKLNGNLSVWDYVKWNAAETHKPSSLQYEEVYDRAVEKLCLYFHENYKNSI